MQTGANFKHLNDEAARKGLPNSARPARSQSAGRAPRTEESERRWECFTAVLPCKSSEKAPYAPSSLTGRSISRNANYARGGDRAWSLQGVNCTRCSLFQAKSRLIT